MAGLGFIPLFSGIDFMTETAMDLLLFAFFGGGLGWARLTLEFENLALNSRRGPKESLPSESTRLGLSSSSRADW